jgi:hypothetical protein
VGSPSNAWPSARRVQELAAAARRASIVCERFSADDQSSTLKVNCHAA